MWMPRIIVRDLLDLEGNMIFCLYANNDNKEGTT